MSLTALFIGNESLLRHCAEHWQARGHAIVAVVTHNAELRSWAEAQGLPCHAPGPDLAERLAQGPAQGLPQGPGGLSYDWLFSIANLSLVPQPLLQAARGGAVNFHDGPLPRHAGLNAPVWALLEGETRHAITWHLIEGEIDEGDILLQRDFEIGAEDTALTLNSRCFEAAIDSFPALLDGLESGRPPRRPQDLRLRSYHARDKRPRAAGLIDLGRPAAEAATLVRALDHGPYRNPLARAKLAVAGRILAVGGATALPNSPGPAAPGTVLAADPEGLTLATAAGSLHLRELTTLDGQPVCPASLAQVGDQLALLAAAEAERIDAALLPASRIEGRLRRLFADPRPAELPGAASPAHGASAAPPDWQSLPLPGLDPAADLAAIALWACRLAGAERVDLALHRGPSTAPGLITDWLPLRLEARATDSPAALSAACRAALAGLDGARGFAADLALRMPGSAPPGLPQIALGDSGPLTGSLLTLTPGQLHFDAGRLSPAHAHLLGARLSQIRHGLPTAQRLADIPAMPEAERRLTLQDWNATATPFDPRPMHHAFEAQVDRSPDATALLHEATGLSYAALEAAANRVAHRLRGLGVGPGQLVGLATGRSPLLLIGALGILKAGGGYVPMDPAYPADRLALYLEDSGAQVVVTDAATAPHLPQVATLLVLDQDPQLEAQSSARPTGGATPDDIAYMIYTSGSTGRPKGVMIEHRQAANFFAGMDQRIGTEPGCWLAVTSLSFDISVLELFWTLARGFRLVLMGDADRALVSNGPIDLPLQPAAPAPSPAPAKSAGGMAFSLYYWGNDDTSGTAKYRLLLEGAKFADRHGFCAVWTPERHFHAFGGPYPNPAVTGAAVAAVTSRIAVRAGSCVAPLHHPARIAEEWAVIDNLTQGRAGLAMASGWQPDDFVLRPENTPPNNRKALFDSIDQVRRLWRGEAVDFPTAAGGSFAVKTQPRPLSPELPIWVTTAGNPETWREAGAMGAHVLTHLLGQDIAELRGKIALYHAALRAAGHDPARFNVTLMLHTYLARDRDRARDTARGPMKAYLRAAAGLIKHYAWAFPAFKKPKGVSTPLEINLADLAEDEMEAILEFAFQRYFDESGLFGTPEDALARVAELQAIGVTEVACLIDYGIPTDTVLEGLYPLAEVVARVAAGAGAGEADASGPAAPSAPVSPVGPAADDYSIAAQIRRHGVTHLQCTPSMARMIAMNDEARAAMAGLRCLMIGGEALPGGLVAELGRISPARILNMYGPTETTIWSTTEPATATEITVNIGTPIANTQVYVLDEAMAPQPVGAAGELWIGGEGVARGYWRRPDLTAERFLPNPFQPGRIYRTGDLVRWRADGRLDFLGRADFQVKLRGHRIELGEIEAVAETCPGVRQAVVIAREDNPGDLQLVAYVTGDSWLVPEALHDHIAARLPGHMVPAHVVRLAEFPLTPNRKIDRKALPRPLPQRPQPDRGAAAGGPSHPPAAPPPPLPTPPAAAQPQGAGTAEDIPAVIAAVWQKVLNLPEVGPRDNFFALGGHSLLAVQVHRELRATFGNRLSITDIFRFPTLQALAQHLTGGPKAATPNGLRPVAPNGVPPAAPETIAGPETVAMGTPPGTKPAHDPAGHASQPGAQSSDPAAGLAAGLASALATVTVSGPAVDAVAVSGPQPTPAVGLPPATPAGARADSRSAAMAARRALRAQRDRV